jgi:tetratricopeptide (TPR) repeat protein
MSMQAADSAWVAERVNALAAAWKRGQRVAVDDLLASRPELSREAAVRLVYEEVCLRRDAGQDVGTAEVVARFPQWKDELEVLLGCDRILRPLAARPAFPDVGALIGPFRLVAELGRGGAGRTYLAVEPALADRPVVLKVIPDDQEEHLRLARLQHTHIVPLFSEQTLPERGLRALCMPYLGGASLAQIFDTLDGIPLDRRRGRDLVAALDRVQLQAEPQTGPCRRYLEAASYVEALCWIGMCLAEALQYAHARGLCHMDIKPSNVLITGDGQPMLLDFHLARGPIAAGECVLGRVGGTPGWMSPEQEAALRAVREGRCVPEAVDGGSDIHALGLLLRGALWGQQHQRPVGVSVGLADIIGRCLAPKRAARYRDAAALADDLRRHLNDLPLRGVANRSVLERWRKWQRRSVWPAWPAVRLAAAAGITMALTLTAAYHAEPMGERRANLQDARHDRAAPRSPAAVRVLADGLEERPRDFWPSFYHGLCAYRLGNYEHACAAFGTCIALTPAAAECYYNRALAHEALGRSDQALADYSRALELDPGLAAAALNRGVLAYKNGRHRDAIPDFLRALRDVPASDRKTISQIHYNLALAYLVAGDRQAALASSEKALGLGYSEAQGLCNRLRHGS